MSDDEVTSNSAKSSVTSYGGSPFDPATDSFSDWATSIGIPNRLYN